MNDQFAPQWEMIDLRYLLPETLQEPPWDTSTTKKQVRFQTIDCEYTRYARINWGTQQLHDPRWHGTAGHGMCGDALRRTVGGRRKKDESTSD